ncbi:MAG: class I SAM-dependent methyltransferase [Thermodesulfobacteriota bacterium]|nr:class I SAM-dependent methyltransferase [Thermodesulfobacteriota bacterium]
MNNNAYECYVKTHFSSIHTFNEKEYEESHKHYERFIGPFLPVDKASRIADIGCGSGFFLNYLKRIGYTNICGVDLSSEQIELCKKLGISEVNVEEGTEFLERNKGVFDLLFSAYLIEHLTKEGVIRLFEAIYNSLGHDGFAILVTNNATPLFSGLVQYFDFTHTMLFTPISLRQALRMAGFQEIGIFPMEPFGTKITSEPRRFLSKIIDKIYRMLFIIEFGWEGYKRFQPVIFTSGITAVARK